jgi:hypothetical protein
MLAAPRWLGSLIPGFLEGQAALSGIRDSGVLDEYVEVAKLPADTLRRRGDRSPIRHVELERDGARPYLLGGGLAAREIARPDQHSEAVCHEFLCDLKTDALISPGDECDAFIVHGLSPSCIDVANAAQLRYKA